MSQWWIRIRGRVMGPLSARELRSRLESGEVQHYHECSPDGVTWGTVADVTEFTPADRPRRVVAKAPPPPVAPPEADDDDELPPPSRRRRNDPMPFAPRSTFGKNKLLFGILGGVLALGVLVLVVVLVLRGVSSRGINLNSLSESEKTQQLESSVCFVVPGHCVTTAKGETLEGYLLPKDIDLNGIKFGGGTGSGFVISAEGHILTNRHVIKHFSEYQKAAVLTEYETARKAKVKPQIWVFFGKDERYPATLEYESPEYDVAILKIEATRTRYFALCDTEPDKIPLLTGLKAVGYPGKDSETIDVTGAVNQALRREEGQKSDFLYQLVERAFPDDQFKLSSRPGEVTKRAELKRMRADQKESYVLRHNAQIFGGNSGGPLICKDGTVLGINTWNLDEPGISFALTLPQLRKAITQYVPKAVWRSHPE